MGRRAWGTRSDPWPVGSRQNHPAQYYERITGLHPRGGLRHGPTLDQMSAKQRDQFRANNIGCVFQRFNLIPYLNAIDNIGLASTFSAGGKAQWRDEASALLSALMIEQSDWVKPTSHLSMGQQQRVAIARALINSPSLLIADEPTSSLDSENRDNFLALLMELIGKRDMTLIFVSHDMALAEHFTRLEALSDITQRPC